MITAIYDLSRAQWENLIDQYVFNSRNREIAKKRLLDGYRIDDLAEEYCLSPERVKKIMAGTKDTLLKHIEKM